MLFESQIRFGMAHNFSDSNEKMPYDFNFAPITINEVREALKKINTKKSTGPDGLDPYFFTIFS